MNSQKKSSAKQPDLEHFIIMVSKNNFTAKFATENSGYTCVIKNWNISYFHRKKNKVFMLWKKILQSKKLQLPLEWLQILKKEHTLKSFYMWMMDGEFRQR